MKQSLGAKTLATPTPVWLIGSYDAEVRPNIMTAAWGGICCSQPPCPDITKVKPMIWNSSLKGYYGIGVFLGKAWEIGKAIETEGTK